MKYFSNFPIINFSNNYARNILSKVKIVDKFKNDSQLFYPYIIEEAKGSVRMENIAYDYYDDPNDVWILYMSNDVVDPYYDVVLSSEDFDAYIIKKYGSIQKANQKIIFYRNNYDQDDSIIHPNAYETLATDVKRYWTPSVNYTNDIIGYERIKDDIVISTNKIISLDLSSNTSLTVGESATQNITGAKGTVLYSNSSVLTLQHIIGQFNGSNIIVGNDSLINCTPTTVTTIKQNLSDTQMVYFSPVTAYEYENELNEQRRNISVLDNRYKPAIHSNFRDIMSE